MSFAFNLVRARSSQELFGPRIQFCLGKISWAKKALGEVLLGLAWDSRNDLQIQPPEDGPPEMACKIITTLPSFWKEWDPELAFGLGGENARLGGCTGLLSTLGQEQLQAALHCPSLFANHRT